MFSKTYSRRSYLLHFPSHSHRSPLSSKTRSYFLRQPIFSGVKCMRLEMKTRNILLKLSMRSKSRWSSSSCTRCHTEGKGVEIRWSTSTPENQVSLLQTMNWKQHAVRWGISLSVTHSVKIEIIVICDKYQKRKNSFSHPNPHPKSHYLQQIVNN